MLELECRKIYLRFPVGKQVYNPLSKVYNTGAPKLDREHLVSINLELTPVKPANDGWIKVFYNGLYGSCFREFTPENDCYWVQITVYPFTLLRPCVEKFEIGL